MLRFDASQGERVETERVEQVGWHALGARGGGSWSVEGKAGKGPGSALCEVMMGLRGGDGIGLVRGNR